MKQVSIYLAFISGKEEWVAYSLTESEARKIASESFWMDDLKGEITVKKVKKEVYELFEPFEFEENLTNHVIYTCPSCKQTYSEDIDVPETKELLICCGNTKKHSDKEDVWILIKNSKEG